MHAFLSAIFLTLVMLLSSAELPAQTVPKGMLMAGGRASLNAVRDRQRSDLIFEASPSLGIFIVDDFAVGGNVVLLAAENIRQLGVGPFVRYYVAPNVFAQGGFGFSFNRYLRLGPEQLMYANAGVGYSIFLNQAVAIEPLLNLFVQQRRYVFGVQAGFQVFLGK